MKDYKPVLDPLTSMFASRFLFVAVLVCLFISLLNYQSEMTVMCLIVLGIFFFTRLWSRFAVSHMKIKFKIDKHRIKFETSVTKDL